MKPKKPDPNQSSLAERLPDLARLALGAPGSELNKQLSALGPVLDQFNASFVKPLQELGERAAAAWEPVRAELDRLSPQWAELLHAMQQVIDDFPGQAKEGLLALAELGWYLDPEMPAQAFQRLKVELEASSLEEANAQLAAYFRQALDRIEADLVKKHPNRATLVSSAFWAHRQARYELSIPVLLSQADGISVEITRCQLYDKSLIGYAKRKQLDALERAYLAPLLTEFSAIRPRGRRLKGDLNRHAVMHGEVVDYGSEENSLRAVSLLNYASFALENAARLMEPSGR